MTQTSTLDIRLIPSVQYVTPTTGQTVTAPSNGHVRSIIDPAGTLLALTYALPTGPSDGDVCDICSSQIVTGFTMSNGTVIGALTSLAVATFASYIFNATASKWFRRG